jgi:RNA polymerase sigma-70 factor (ECF subfamily)
MDDRALVETLRSGDAHAATHLVERFKGVVFGLCYRMMRNREDAEDVVQETFLRAFRGISGFDPDRPIRPWLLGIAANRCRTAITRRTRRPHQAVATDEYVDHRPGLDDPDDLRGDLERALGHLREEYRLVFTLYHEQDLPYEEIAQVVGRPVGTVKTWIHRARAELAADLSRRGIHC